MQASAINKIKKSPGFENLTREQLVAKLDELQKKGIGIAGEENIIDVTPEKEQPKLIED